MIGPGKYDDLCTHAREASDASAVILIVLGGNKGPGFCVQASPEEALALPAILRHIAAEIEREDNREEQHGSAH